MKTNLHPVNAGAITYTGRGDLNEAAEAVEATSRRQYFAAMTLHYWHPSYQERRDAARAWEARDGV